MIDFYQHPAGWALGGNTAVEKTTSGVIPLRFPEAFYENLRDPVMRRIARFTTGVELQFFSNDQQATVEVRVLDDDGFGLLAEVFQGWHKLPGYYPLPGASGQVHRIELNLAPARRESTDPFRLLFPTHCALEIISVQGCVPGRFQKFDYRASADQPPLRWLVCGDSITQGANGVSPASIWVEQVARALHLQPINWGIGGYGLAEPELAEAVGYLEHLDLISIHFGANACKPAFQKKFMNNLTPFLISVRAAHPESPIVFATPSLHHHEIHHGEGDMQGVRDFLAETFLELMRQGFANITVVDGLHLLADRHLLLADLIHYSDAAHFHFAANLIPHLRGVIANTKCYANS